MARWIYILNYLSQPDTSTISLDGKSLDPKGPEVWNPSGLSSLGIKLVPVSLIWKSGRATKLFGIEIKGGEKEDESAQRFADAAMATVILVNPGYAPEFPIAFPVPVAKLGKQGEIAFDQLVEEDAQKDYRDRYSETGLRVLFGTTYGLLADEIARVWEMLPTLLLDSHLFDAAHFYWASRHEFVFLGDGIREILDNINATPVSRIALVRAENAIQNAFEAIEALIGDPPKDDERLGGKINAAGLDPDEHVGWDIPEYGLATQSILERVRELSEMRDKRAAHARTSANRRITYFEMMKAQDLALDFIFASVEKRLREFDKGTEMA